MSNYEDKFLLAVQLQDHETIERLIDKDVDVNTRNGNALTVAANQGDYKTVSMLLNAGAEANLDKSKALILAAQNGHTELVELLMDYGAENVDGALKAAAKKKAKESVWLLLNRTSLDNKFNRISRNERLMETIKEILISSDGSYTEALMFLITDDDIESIEEITKTDLLDRLRAFHKPLTPKPEFI